MKLLENRSCKMGYGIHQFEAFEKLDFTSEEIKSLPIPLGIVLVPGYTNSKKVCYHPNLSSLLSSLICTSPKSFADFVNEYCEEFRYTCKLLQLLNGKEFAKDMISKDDLDLSDRILKFLGKHREELREFVTLLRINKPVGLEEDLLSPSDFLKSPKRFYASCFLVDDIECYEPMLSVMCNNSYTGSFKMNFDLLSSDDYKKVIKENYKGVDLFSLDMAFNNCIVELFNFYDSNKVDPNVYYKGLLLRNSIIYDLVYETLNKLWRI